MDTCQRERKADVGDHVMGLKVDKELDGVFFLAIALSGRMVDHQVETSDALTTDKGAS